MPPRGFDVFRSEGLYCLDAGTMILPLEEARDGESIFAAPFQCSESDAPGLIELAAAVAVRSNVDDHFKPAECPVRMVER